MCFIPRWTELNIYRGESLWDPANKVAYRKLIQRFESDLCKSRGKQVFIDINCLQSIFISVLFFCLYPPFIIISII